MNNSLKIKRLVGVASLAAIVIVLQLLSNYITIGTVSITLALIPIAVGAIVYGPLAGFVLGAIMGLVVLSAPSTIAYFVPVNLWATIILCVLKTGLAGLASGFLFKLIKKHNFYVAIIAASLIVPIVNTGLFIAGATIFFKEVYGADNTFVTVIGAVLTTNFLLEFVINVALAPAVATIVRILARNYDLGFSLDIDKIGSLDSEPKIEE